MSDPHGSASPAASQAGGRDTRVETLLLEGLDQYFAGRYEDAIHTWTRVLFVDRSHARARAYIDRARSALADRGRTAGALVPERLGVSTPPDSTVEPHGSSSPASSPGAAPTGSPADRRTASIPGWQWPGPSRTTALVVGLAFTAVVLLLASVLGPRWVVRYDDLHHATTARAPVWPALSATDASLARVRYDIGRGRLSDAIEALDRLDADAAAREDVDRLRAAVRDALAARLASRSHTGADLP